MELLLISSSNVHGYGYLEHAEPEIRRMLAGRKRVAFVPFAAHDHVTRAAEGVGFDEYRGPCRRAPACSTRN